VDELLSPPQRKALAELRAQLGEPEMQSAFAAVVEAWASSLATHEVQHRFDDRARLRMPAALEKRVGPATDRRGKRRELAAVALAESSAYLAQLAGDRGFLRLDLALLAGYLFDAQLAGTAECYAAILLFETLATELGLPTPKPLVRELSIDREQAATLYGRLAAQEPEALRVAARAAWRRLFGRELVVPQRLE
jgi:hypothetical protein